ncbi:hypothetical protein QJS66_20350 [Kocuria rhizophila]|nr:hypothetical protein QJS66_20350 [Kocuria rhizophila]
MEPRSTVWRQADEYEVPRICFVNEIGQAWAPTSSSPWTPSVRLGAAPLVLQLPIGAENDSWAWSTSSP